MPEANVASIAASQLPVLCFDTCTALDLMRDPTRDSVKAHERKAALELLGAAEGSPRLVLLMAEQVDSEFSEHADGVEGETRTALQNLVLRMQRLDAVAAVYGAMGAANLDHLNDHAVEARKIADRWVNAAALVPQGTDIASKAIKRVLEARTPAKKGKDSTKDCLVIETYLDIAAQLRAAGLSTPIVYVSSNVKDYAEETGSRLRADLASEFALLNMEFAPNIGAAKHLLSI